MVNLDDHGRVHAAAKAGKVSPPGTPFFREANQAPHRPNNQIAHMRASCSRENVSGARRAILTLAEALFESLPTSHQEHQGARTVDPDPLLKPVVCERDVPTGVGPEGLHHRHINLDESDPNRVSRISIRCWSTMSMTFSSAKLDWEVDSGTSTGHGD